jgi:hypothetical protein
MTAPQHDRDGGRRKRYSKPRNGRRDKVISLQEARERTWQAGLSYSDRLRIARTLDHARVKFMTTNRIIAAEMQRLRMDVLK